jgi:hypothetical protein
MEGTGVPEEIGYDSSDVKRAATRPSLRTTASNEWMQFVVKGPATKSVSQKHNYTLAMECAPLDATGSPRFPTVKNRLTIPVANKEVEGHKAPNTAGICRGYLEAVGAKGILATARWNSDAGGWVKPDGTVIPRDQKGTADKYNEDAAESVIQAMLARWKDPSMFERDTFYAQVKRDGQNINLVNITGTLPGDAVLITEKFGE